MILCSGARRITCRSAVSSLVLQVISHQPIEVLPNVGSHMNSRIDNPALTVPGVLKALQSLQKGRSVGLTRQPLRSISSSCGQSDQCGVCVDIHSHELELADEPDHRINLVAAWRETRLLPPRPRL